VIAVGGWAFWMVISRLSPASEIGQATAIYSLVLLVTTITQLGLEYPLLKKVNSSGSRTFGTVLAIELAITAASILPIFLILDNGYSTDSNHLWLAIGILVFSSLSFVGRFALLGASNSKNVLIIDVVGIVLRFGLGIALVSLGFGVTGILVGFLAQTVVATVAALLIGGRRFGLGLGNRNTFRETIRDSLANAPSKLSSMMIVSLSVVLLSLYGVADDEVGIFYIAVMLSVVAASFASSLAYMSIPASSEMKTDLSSGSLRLGLGFTAPIVAALVVAPGAILSLVGDEYSRASEALIVLASGILPAVVLSNAISKYNNVNRPSKLIAIGGIRLASFLIAFYLLVPMAGILGASYAILLSFLTSISLTLVWSERNSFKLLGIATLSVGIGVIVGRLVELATGSNPLVTILATVLAASVVVFGLKCLSASEIANIVRMIRR